jgi:periplasmic protein TonB
MPSLPVSLQPLSPTASVDELGPSGRRALTAGVLAAHLLGGWALLQVDSVRQAVVEAAPIMVDWIAAPQPRPAPTPPPPPSPAARPTPAPQPRPLLAAPAAPNLPAPVFAAPAPEPTPAPPSPVETSPASPAPPAPAAPPPAPRQIAASAIQYLVPPPLEVPLASRRLNEQGTVWVRVVVDVQGLPRQVLLHQSSGFGRLDEQALKAMRAARFKPASDNGVAYEWTAVAPLQYELE